MENVRVCFEMPGDIKKPVYATENSAGCDLFSPVELVLRPGEKLVIPMGFKMALPEGYEAQIRPRSGLSLKTTLCIPNSPGTVDSDYRDEVGIIAENCFSSEIFISMLKTGRLTAEYLKNHYRYLRLNEYTGTDLFGDKGIYIDENDNPFGSIYIKKGDRIAQMVICRYCKMTAEHVADIKETGTNRGGGFGHTGLR